MASEHKPLRYIADLQFTSFLKKVGESGYTDLYSPVSYMPKSYEINILNNNIFNFEPNDYSEDVDFRNGTGTGSVKKTIIDIGKNKNGAPVYLSCAVTRVKDGDFIYRVAVIYASLSENIDISPYDMFLGIQYTNDSLSHNYPGNCWNGQNIILCSLGGTNYSRTNTIEDLHDTLTLRFFIFSQMLIDFQILPGSDEPVEVVISDDYWGRVYLIESANSSEIENYSEDNENYILHGVEEQGFASPDMTFGDGYIYSYKSGRYLTEDYMVYPIGSSSNDEIYNSIKLLFNDVKTGGFIPKRPSEESGTGGQIPSYDEYPDGRGGEYGNTRDWTGDEENNPSLPSIGFITSGFTNNYVCNSSEIINLRNFLWSDDSESLWTKIQKRYNNPMNCILSLSCIPVNSINIPSERHNIYIGGINTNVESSLITNEFIDVDCGILNLKGFYGNFLDYEPYTSIKLYLPFCGEYSLKCSDVYDTNLHLFYRFNVLTGDVVAWIRSKCRTTKNESSENIKYIFTGSCKLDLPISGRETNLNALINFFNGAVNTGVSIATSNPMGILEGVKTLASAELNYFNPNISHVGSMGMSSSYMLPRTPKLIISSPKCISTDGKWKEYGKKSNMYKQIKELKETGFNSFSNFHLKNCKCTNSEKEKIERYLREGVIL